MARGAGCSTRPYAHRWTRLEKGGAVLLPRDDTPGCTIEANQFTALAGEFAQLDTVILGVSKDSCESHQAFIDKYGLKVNRLAAEEATRLYGEYMPLERARQSWIDRIVSRPGSALTR